VGKDNKNIILDIQKASTEAISTISKDFQWSFLKLYDRYISSEGMFRMIINKNL